VSLRGAVTLIVTTAAAVSVAHAEEPKQSIAAARAACEDAAPTCDPSALLSKLERRSVERALAARGLEIDHAPYGKRVAAIHVVPFDVFGPGDGFLRWFNLFHMATVEEAVRGELVFSPGEAWDQRRADESSRRLRDPLNTSLVAIVPVRAAVEGDVDVLVVTRDVWSLRANSNYEIQENQITFLSLSLSENNLLGRRKLLAATFRMDQATYSIGPLYIDRNMFGRHIDLRGRGGPIFNRYTSELEGSDSAVVLSRPLWSLDTDWGASLDWSHRFALNRSFSGADVRLFDPASPDDNDACYLDPPAECVRHEYRMRRMGFAATVTRGFGDRIEQRVRGGYQLESQRPTLLDDFPMDEAIRQSFIDNVLPRSERTGVLFTGWELFEPRYRNFQNVSTFELAEDTRLGVELEATVGLAREEVLSENNFVRLSGAAGYTGAWGGDGLWLARTAATTRLEDGEAIDNIVEARLRLVTPSIELGRLVSEVKVAGLFRDRQNEFYSLGGDNGLRGFRIGAFVGDRRVLWQTELRTKPVPILFTRWGLVAFHDAGGTADRFESLELHHDAGLGIRMLVPQLNPELFRFDFAFALDAGIPASQRFRFSAGYEQSF
jgi:hypothetical protein